MIRPGQVAAQEDAPAPLSAPAPAAVNPNGPTGSTLFPGEAYTPAPELEENRARAAGNRQARRAGKRQAGRANDVFSAKAAADPLEVRLAFRKAKTEALLRHPELTVLVQQAADAPTDREKREFLRLYYTQLYAAVKKVDPSPTMADHVKTLGKISQQRYDPKRRAVGGEEDIVGGGGRGRRR